MKKPQKTSFSFTTFKNAFQGLLVAFREQFNFKIHFFFASLALFASWFFAISIPKLLFILLAIFLVFVAELFNSAIEYLSDTVTQEFHPLIKKVKDISAGAVLLMALFSVIIGLVIFLPYFKQLL